MIRFFEFLRNHPVGRYIYSPVSYTHLDVYKRQLINRYIFADKIYSDFSFWGNKQQEQGVTMMTPVKAIKGEMCIRDSHQSV